MLSELIARTNTLPSDMTVTYQGISQGLIFSNTGRRGDTKYFSITLRSIIQTLIDIRNNLDRFSTQTSYNEGKWRDLLHSYLTDAPTNAMSTVQTLPLFNLLAKIIFLTNNHPVDDFDDKTIILDDQALNTTITYLQKQLPVDGALPTPAIGNIKGQNIIYYGAPGTGKSHKVDEQLHGHTYKRTVFHSETQYSDFVGSLKPVIETITDTNGVNRESLSYKFVPGPFTEAYIDAVNNPTQHVYLVIEEINRAPAAGVFGELFQLLDRDANGLGQYTIDATDPMMSNYIKGQLNIALTERLFLRMPSNLSLLATMNSSDQAVMPMDTAFKRRWKFCYIKLEFSICAEGSIPVTTGDVPALVSWKHLAQTLNTAFAGLHITEDRHFGPFFVQTYELFDAEAAKETLTGKLLLYVWDDILRHRDHGAIFHESINTFGDLIRRYEASDVIFNEAIQAQLLEDETTA